MIFVIFSSGGGTGSGAAPMLIDLLVDDDRTVGAITIIPAETESLKSQMNSYESMKELLTINDLASCFMIDNNNGDKLELNEQFVNSFDRFVTIPNRDKSTKGIIDKAEVIETLKAHGMAYVIESDSSSASIIDKIKSNIFVPLDGDQVVKYITVSISGETKLADIQKAIGTPLDTFVTYNDTSTVCCISGLSYPQQRLDSVYKIVDESKETIVKNLKSTLKTSMKDDINFLSEMANEKKQANPEHKPKSKRDIMSKYL